MTADAPSGHDDDLGATLVDLSSTTVSWLRRTAFVLAIGAIALSFLGRRYGWLEFRPGGAAFEVAIRPVFIGIFAVSLLLAVRWPLAGGVLAGFAGAALLAFAREQLVAEHAIAVTVALLVPGALWLVVDLADEPPRRALVAVGLAVTLAGVGYFAGQRIYAHFWGPTHPSTTVAALPDSPVEWVWSGAVTTSAAEVRAHPRDDYDEARLALSTSAELTDPRWIDAGDEAGRVVGFRFDGLEPDTEYHYAVEIDGELDLVRAGRLRTFPEGPASFTVAVGACARVGSNGRVFDTIRETDPLLYLITGDLHYGDNGRDEIERYQEVMDLTLSRPAQQALYLDAPVAYVWDDHDYGPNDADGNSPSRRAAMAAYREHVPSYPLAGPESAVYQAFTVGRVRFVLTDARSARNTDLDEVTGRPSMLGFAQKEWLKAELATSAQTHELVVWVNPVPWVAEARDGADHWAGFPEERRELADHIAENGIDNLLMVAGDAHMVAIDDGTNTDYSSDGSGGFPLLHSAPLDRPGGVKGGPYSHGAVASGGQFATIEVTDDGDDLTVRLVGLDWEGTELMSYEFTTS